MSCTAGKKRVVKTWSPILPRRQNSLQELHERHPGISKMKSLAHIYVWCPGINSVVEKPVRTCYSFRRIEHHHISLHSIRGSGQHDCSHAYTLIFAGPFENHVFLILIDAHSKWVKVICTPNATSTTVITELKTFLRDLGCRTQLS